MAQDKTALQACAMGLPRRSSSFDTRGMNVFPRTGAGWMRVILLPIQVYVATAWMVLKIYVEASGRHRDYEFNGLIIIGYAFSIVALCAGAYLQRKFGDRKGAGLNVLIAIAAVILLPMCFPVL